MVLTPKHILEINHDARKDIDAWLEVLKFGDAVNVSSCADARIPLSGIFGPLHQAEQPIALIGVHSIAASEEQIGYKDHFLNLNRLRAAVTITHFSQRKSARGVSPLRLRTS